MKEFFFGIFLEQNFWFFFSPNLKEIFFQGFWEKIRNTDKFWMILVLILLQFGNNENLLFFDKKIFFSPEKDFESHFNLENKNIQKTQKEFFFPLFFSNFFFTKNFLDYKNSPKIFFGIERKAWKLEKDHCIGIASN